MNYYLISGEASGDLHGAHLIKALKKIDSNAHFRAWGGDLMEKEGATIVKHYSELAFMGFWEVISHLPTILKNISRCKKDILTFNPDVIIYIDYPGFNLRIAKWAKEAGYKNHYYISPQVWAWKENRVNKMKQYLDALYVILPFEKGFFEKKHNFDVHFVGHPLLDHIPSYPKKATFHIEHKLESKKPIIALLPGSRLQEIKKMLPLFIEVAKNFSDYQFVIAAAPGLSIESYAPYIKNSSLKIIHNATYSLLQHSSAALVTSGTATLETALFDVPQLVCYRSSAFSYWIAKKIVKLNYISLVNLILDRLVVKELIQDALNLSNLCTHLQQLLNPAQQRKLKQDYKELKSILGNGGASNKTAQLIFTAISKDKI